MQKVFNYSVIIFFIAIFVSSVLAQTQVISRIENEPVKKEPNIFEKFLNWLQTHYIEIIVVLIAIGFIILLSWLIWRFIKRKKEEEDIHLRYFRTSLMLARQQADPSRLKPNNMMLGVVLIMIFSIIEIMMLLYNSPLIIVVLYAFILLPVVAVIGLFLKWFGMFARPDPIYVYDGKNAPKFLGFYQGDYIEENAYHNIAYYRGRKYIFFKNFQVLKANMNPVREVIQKEKNKKGKFVDVAVKYPMENNLIIPLRSMMFIKGTSVDRFPNGYFTYPVLKDKDGNIVNSQFLHADSLKSAILAQTLIDQSASFASALRESILINPSLRYTIRSGTETVDSLQERERARYYGEG